MHLKTMFILIHAPAHGLEIPCLLELLHKRRVDGQVAQRRCVCGAGGRGSAGEVVVVRGAEEEDSLTIFIIIRQSNSSMWNTVRGENARIRPVGGLVGPCSGRPGVRVAGVSAWMSLAICYIDSMCRAHGAIMARAFCVGIETLPCCDDVVPMGVVVSGTASSQSSSC